MLASAVDVLDATFDALKGRFGGAGSRVPSPTALGSIAAWYDASDISSMVYDGSNRVSLWSDKSGNSAVNCLVLNGSSGNYASAPDSAAVSITGDIDLRANISLASWTPAASQPILSKDDGAAQRSYLFYVNATDGKLSLNFTVDGSTLKTVQSSVGTGFSALASSWVRMTRVASTGVSNFYTSTDGTTWAQLGSANVAGFSGNLFDSTTALDVGRYNAAGLYTSGRIYRAQIYNGIAGTLAFDFNPALSAKLATTATDQSVNAATITINTSGATGARISGERDLYQGTVASQPVLTIAAGANLLTFDGTDDYLKAAPFSLSQPETVYFVGKQVSWTLNDVLFDGNANDGMQIYQKTSTPTIAHSAGVTLPQSGNLAVGALALISSVFNGASSSLRINRLAPDTGNSGSNAANGFTLGAAGTSAAGPSNITASEIAIYSAAHDTATQDRAANYFSRKWRLGF